MHPIAGVLHVVSLSGTMPPYEIIEVDEATDPIYEVAEEGTHLDLFVHVAAHVAGSTHSGIP